MVKFQKFLIILIILVLSGCGSEISINESEKNEIDKLWSVTITPFLKDNQYNTQFQYDAGHSLIIPLYYAFKIKDVNKVAEFAEQFIRFNKEDRQILGDIDADLQLSRLHYLYLVSEFFRMCSENIEVCNGIEYKTLKNRVRLEINSFFIEKPYFWYEGLEFKGGLKSNIEYKLEKIKLIKSGNIDWPDYRYYYGITDFDLFALSIIANVGDEIEKKEAIKLAIDIFKLFGKEYEGNYIFQTGIWFQHRDYRYAGNLALLPNLKESLMPDLPEDSSHSHRLPAFITSLKKAAVEEDKKFFEQLEENMGNNFYRNVIVKEFIGDDKMVLLKNYMNGWNGVYRYNYNTVGANLGYGPYELSGILIEGWWCLFKDKSQEKYWQHLSQSFPLNSTALKIYMGPNTTRLRHPLVTWPDFFTNGFGEMNSKICSYLQSN